ncbi:DeoR/GlpR family DNA-binding transcription regulator [Paenibacillus guangzhouensis]|uniref:DeoR/GlpR family DNA-binding transcription regulator n=1 Tax=Paenibacillus guangzhouensis TaxID=1473112 RepID=UPI001266B143|nr:DeoR/GlpR transcriptional regulator [Paenibacillus guangzhouensis]
MLVAERYEKIVNLVNERGSIRVTTELSSKDNIEVISTGGILAPRSMSFVGPLAERSLDAYHVSKVFLSCKGIHLERGISESGEWQARIKEKMISIADQAILLADYSKFDMQSFAQISALTVIDVIITDDRIPKQMIAQLEERGITVITA